MFITDDTTCLQCTIIPCQWWKFISNLNYMYPCNEYICIDDLWSKLMLSQFSDTWDPYKRLGLQQSSVTALRLWTFYCKNWRSNLAISNYYYSLYLWLYQQHTKKSWCHSMHLDSNMHICNVCETYETNTQLAVKLQFHIIVELSVFDYYGKA